MEKLNTSPRKAPRQDRSRETVDVILEATARVLKEVGYDRASTNRIAEVAGVSVGSLYRYFPSKEALVAELCDRHISAMLALCETKILELGEAPMDVAAREIVSAILHSHAVDPKLHRILIQQVPRVGKLKNVDSMNGRVAVLVRAYLEARRDEVRPKNLDLAVFMLVHAVEAVCHAAVIERSEHLRDGELHEELAALVLRYLEMPAR
jgi:AcrR family transcriptional regulator